MLLRKVFWLTSIAQFFVAINAGFFDKGSDADESQTPPNGKIEYGVDMVRRQYILLIVSNALTKYET
jgi:hypothetical protein